MTCFGGVRAGLAPLLVTPATTFAIGVVVFTTGAVAFTTFLAATGY
jgi:hypothetical protein